MFTNIGIATIFATQRVPQFKNHQLLDRKTKITQLFSAQTMVLTDAKVIKTCHSRNDGSRGITCITVP